MNILAYAELGWRLMPCHPRTKRGMWPHTSASSKPAVLETWQQTWPDANWAVLAGPGSGILALDVDGPAGEHELRRLELQHGLLPNGPAAISGGDRRGWHAYLRWPEGRGVRNMHLAPELESRGDTLLLTLPPSVHPDTGRRYRWAEGRSPFDVELPEAPEWLCELLKPEPLPEREPVEVTCSDAYVRRAIDAEIEALAGAMNGQRNHALNRAGFSLFRFAADGKIGAGDLAEGLMQAALQAGLPEIEARKTVQSAARARGISLR